MGFSWVFGFFIWTSSWEACWLIYAQIPLDGPDQTLSETQVYDLVSDKVRSGLRQVHGLCLVIDLSVQSWHVRILSVGLVGSQTKSVGPCSGIWKRHDQTNDILLVLSVCLLIY